MEKFEQIADSINAFVWGPPLLVLLVGTHIFLTFKTGFIQRWVGKGIKLSIAKDRGSTGDVSQFAALCTAMSATLGIGNIVGVGTAIALGGPGAVLWMWLCGVFGIATKYSECLISVKYRVKDDKGMMLGGAMFALERGLKMKWLAVIFALFAATAAFGIGSMVQANSVSEAVYETATRFNWVATNGLTPEAVASQKALIKMIAGIVIFILSAIVIVGGLKSIARVAEKCIPAIALIYTLGVLILLCMNITYVPAAVALICTRAFAFDAMGGGVAGFVMVKMLQAARFGVARGLFSNESGMGSAPLVAAAAQTRNPVRQALISSTGTFWDTVVMNLITSLMIICAGLAKPELFIREGAAVDGGALVRTAFGEFGPVGTAIFLFSLTTFAITTIWGWAYYGEKGFEYLCGTKFLMGYRIVFCLAAFFGAIGSLTIVWNIADTLNGLMVIPNVVAMLLLSGVIAKETKKYLINGSIDDMDPDPVPLRSDLPLQTDLTPWEAAKKAKQN